MKFLRSLQPLIAIALVGSLASCMSHTELMYGPFERKLNADAELVISTYSARIPRETSHTPYVAATSKSSDAVYFQVHVREPGRKMGPNTKVESITIHTFAYQLEDREWVTLIKDHPKGFWMQGNRRYDPGSDPVPYIEDGEVKIRIELSLDGERRQIEAVMAANRKTTVIPLFLRNMGV